MKRTPLPLLLAVAMSTVGIARLSPKEADPQDAKGHFKAAKDLERMHNWKGAIRELQEAIRLEPNYTEARYFLAWDLAELNRLNDALEELSEAIRLDRNQIAELVRLDKPPEFGQEFARASGNADAHLVLGIMLRDFGKLDKAAHEMQMAVAGDPNFALALLLLGQVQTHQGNPAQGWDTTQTAIHMNPTLGKVLIDQMKAREEERMRNERCQEARRRIKLLKRQADTMTGIGSLISQLPAKDQLQDKQMLQRFAQDVKEAVQMCPDSTSTEGHILLGSTDHELGDSDEAALEYREALRLAPDSGEAHNKLGLVLLQKDPTEAQNHLQTACKLDRAVCKDYEKLNKSKQ